MIDLNDAEAILQLAKRLVSERKHFDKISARQNHDNTPKRAQKIQADMNWQAMEIDKIELDLHAACVDGGVAAPRDDCRYGPAEYHPSGFHSYTYQPAIPRVIAARREAK